MTFGENTGVINMNKKKGDTRAGCMFCGSISKAVRQEQAKFAAFSKEYGIDALETDGEKALRTKHVLQFT